MNFFEYLFVPTILFMVVVLPIWLTMHYRHKGRLNSGLTQEDQATLDDLLRTLDNMADRVEALESILDERNPRWKRGTD
ncbi:envelope stress response membrane protein PspB [Saccharospirillum salsuginis]|uniref:Phage shock protein B n=1 Tax=Saccharospirillum salsuginis TaxID=418750 RepID=A0A918KWG2_9GAMM|nr:envelope stress response membrane protein PspB [Saccharospirillum salsuginis]GGX76297.1 phage shock protein B [Saccharospirillum salsuginis]